MEADHARSIDCPARTPRADGAYAGGNLTLAMGLRVKQDKLRLPAAIARFFDRHLGN